MKNAIAILFASLFCAVSLMAADNAGFTYGNGVFTITEAGSITLKYYSPASKYGQDNVIDFGYYFLNDKDNKISLDTHLKGNKKVTLKDLPKDSQIGLYLTTKKDTDPVIYSDPTENIDGREVFFQAEDNKGEYYTFGDDKWTKGDVLAFKLAFTPAENGGTEGQPLPGLLTTCAIAAGIGAGARALKRRKNAQK